MNQRISSSWLQAACVLTIVFGLVAAAGSFPATSGPWLALFDLIQWPLDGSPAAFDPSTRAVNAVLGGVMVGWGTVMLLLVRALFARDAHLVRRLLLPAVWVWFFVDTSGSLLAGLPGNGVLNVGFLAVFLPPLLLMKSSRNP